MTFRIQGIFALHRHPTLPEGFNSVRFEVEIDRLDASPTTLAGVRTLDAWPFQLAIHEPPMTGAPSWKADISLTAPAESVDDFIERIYALHESGDLADVA